ncbi:MAG: iron ABC transporter permease [Pyramidobacter sp.]|uniref:FecCD family ABC transporter permease n=1 Tax=Pyramidobacter sp. TaxID=1943581 RepID=UPI002A837904|nr:iron ABC transporter permease [Pyramidobacter sp.]MDY4032649.1 iron ABC transporter permease [Pyramidobacter sp.]
MPPSPAGNLGRWRSQLRARYFRLGAALGVLLFLTALWRITQGEWNIPLSRVFELLSPFLPAAESETAEALVIRAVRLPRFFAAAGAGGLLAVSGVVLQGLLANPLAEPYTLGIAAGAAFGGAMGFFFDRLAVTPTAFAGALGSLALVNLIARKNGGSGAYLVLAGIVANAVLSAGVTLLKAVADDKLGAIVLWLMGSFSGASPAAARLVWLGAAITLIPAWLYGRQLDAVSLGEGQGEMLGVDEKKLRRRLLCAASLGTAMSVSSFGIIGFVGLVAPHVLRLLVGPSHRPLLVFSFLAGALLTALADGAAQRLGELPVGVITALIGGPFFCWILVKRK